MVTAWTRHEAAFIGKGIAAVGNGRDSGPPIAAGEIFYPDFGIGRSQRRGLGSGASAHLDRAVEPGPGEGLGAIAQPYPRLPASKVLFTIDM
mgnify:CR=1 FL=1